MTVPPEHRAEREQEHGEAVAAIEHAISEIEGQRREPDQWERTFLLQAISWLFRGGYRLAVVNAELALTPPNQRAREANIRSDPVIDRCNLSLLREALRETATRPVSDFPAFGPIIFTRN